MAATSRLLGSSARTGTLARARPAVAPHVQCRFSTRVSSCHQGRLRCTSALPSSQRRCQRQAQQISSRQLTSCRAAANEAAAAPSEDDIVRVATNGDIVTIHFTAKDTEGRILESSKDSGEPLSFEVGAGEIMGNKLFQGFDEAVRGLAVGQMTVLEASGGEWQRDLLFVVPRDHPEILRLEGRYKNQGGLNKDMIVELANGSLAVVVEVADDVVKLDANNMMAGKTLVFELEVLGIAKPPAEDAEGVVAAAAAQNGAAQ